LVKDITTYTITETQPLMGFEDLCLGTGKEVYNQMQGEVAHEMQEENVDPYLSISNSTTGWSKHLDRHLPTFLSKTEVRVANSWTVLRAAKRNSTVHRANKALKFGPSECQHNRPSIMMMKEP
jgi:hypothetical protein